MYQLGKKCFINVQRAEKLYIISTNHFYKILCRWSSRDRHSKSVVLWSVIKQTFLRNGAFRETLLFNFYKYLFMYIEEITKSVGKMPSRKNMCETKEEENTSHRINTNQHHKLYYMKVCIIFLFCFFAILSSDQLGIYFHVYLLENRNFLSIKNIYYRTI